MTDETKNEGQPGIQHEPEGHRDHNRPPGPRFASPWSWTGVADQLDIGVESLRSWVKQAEIDRGDRGGTTSEDAARIKALEQENRELKRASEILQRAASFFGAELDRRQK